MLILILTVACTIIGVSSQSQQISTTPEPTVPTCNLKPSASTSNPQSSVPNSDPEPSKPTSDPQISGPNSDSQPSGPNSDPQPSGPNLEPNPTDPTSDPQPSGPNSDPQTSGPNSDPQPSGPNSDPQPSVPNLDPNPTDPTSDSQPSGPNSDPQPSGPNSDPQPSVPNLDPNPTDPTSDSQPSGPNSDPQPSVPTSDGQPSVPGYNPQPSVPGYNPQPSLCSTFHWGSPTIQFLTSGLTHNADGLFFHQKDKKLCFCDRLTSKCYSINLETGKEKHYYVNISEGKQVAFKYPLLNLKADSNGNNSSTDEVATNKKYLIGIGNEIAPETYNASTSTELTAPPITITEDKGYIICKAHADRNGNLFITMNSKTDKKHRHGRLYKIELKKPVLVKQFDCDVHDFVWSQDYKDMYIITDHGKCIKKYSYDETKREISNEEKVFKMPHTANPADAMTGIEIDKKNYLWVTVEYCGNVMQIDSKTGKVKFTTQMPITMLTGLTFGDKNDLFISTSKKCNLPENGAGSILYLSGINGAGVGDNEVLL